MGTSAALAVEMPPEVSELAGQHKQFMRSLSAMSEGMLAAVDPDKMKVLSLCCSHMSAGLACAACGAGCANEQLAAIAQDGRLSLARLRELQPTMAEAVDVGLGWTIL